MLMGSPYFGQLLCGKSRTAECTRSAVRTIFTSRRFVRVLIQIWQFLGKGYFCKPRTVPPPPPRPPSSFYLAEPPAWGNGLLGGRAGEERKQIGRNGGKVFSRFLLTAFPLPSILFVVERGETANKQNGRVEEGFPWLAKFLYLYNDSPQ